MKELSEYKEKIHSCSKCGLCQSVCPVYKITHNDCTVSRGLFIMLMGMIKGDLKMSKTIKHYLDLCLECNACSNFCPSGIDIPAIIASAKSEYFNNSIKEKMLSFLYKHIILDFAINVIYFLSLKWIKQTHFKKINNTTKKVLYFGGCSAKISGVKNISKLMKQMGFELITPNFDCCGLQFYLRGDFNNFEYYKQKFIKIVEKYDIKDIVTTCSSCEKALKMYDIPDLNIKNVLEYVCENKPTLELKKNIKVTFHKPCYMENSADILQTIKNIKNLEYIEMNDFDKCCGFEGLLNLKEIGVMLKILLNKRKNIISSGAKIVLTSCQRCKFVLNLLSFGQYKVENVADFITKNSSF